MAKKDDLKNKDIAELTEELREALGVEPEVPAEEKICLFFCGCLVALGRRGAGAGDSMATAQSMRNDFWAGAFEALNMLAEPPPWITRAEYDLGT